MFKDYITWLLKDCISHEILKCIKLQDLKEYFDDDELIDTFFFLGPPRTFGGSFQPS